MLEFAPEMPASEPFTRIHWYVYLGLVSPSASRMPVVTAVSVSPTRAVPVMVGAPVGAWLVVVVPAAVPLTVNFMRRVELDHGSVMTLFHAPLPMLHPMAAPVSAVASVKSWTLKPWPSDSALLLLTSQ